MRAIADEQYEYLVTTYGDGDEYKGARMIEHEGVMRLAARHSLFELIHAEGEVRKSELTETSRNLYGAATPVLTPLMEAVVNGVEANTATFPSRDGQRPFIQIETVQALIALAPEAANIADRNGHTPLEQAAMKYNWPNARDIMRVTADVNAGVSTPLFHAEFGFLTADQGGSDECRKIRSGLKELGGQLRPEEHAILKPGPTVAPFISPYRLQTELELRQTYAPSSKIQRP